MDYVLIIRSDEGIEIELFNAYDKAEFWVLDEILGPGFDRESEEAKAIVESLAEEGYYDNYGVEYTIMEKIVR